MPASIGRAIILEWGEANSAIAGVREKSLTLNGEAVDVTSDDSDGWRELLSEASQSQVDISVSGVTKDDTLRAEWFAGRIANTVTLTYPDGGTISGTFILTNYTETAAYNDAVTFEATLQSSGEVTYTPAS